MSEPGYPPEPVRNVGRDLASSLGPNVRTLTLDLTTARNNEKISLAGLVFYVFDSVGSDAQATVRFNEPSDSGFVAQRAVSIRGIRFHEIYVTNVAQPGKSLTFLVSMAPIEVDLASTIASLVAVERPDSLTGNALTVTNAVNSSIAARAGRDTIFLQALASNTLSVWIGFDNTVSSSNGVELAPGTTLSLDTEAAVWINATTGTGQNIRYLETYKA